MIDEDVLRKAHKSLCVAVIVQAIKDLSNRVWIPNGSLKSRQRAQSRVRREAKAFLTSDDFKYWIFFGGLEMNDLDIDSIRKILGKRLC